MAYSRLPALEIRQPNVANALMAAEQVRGSRTQNALLNARMERDKETNELSRQALTDMGVAGQPADPGQGDGAPAQPGIPNSFRLLAGKDQKKAGQIIDIAKKANDFQREQLAQRAEMAGRLAFGVLNTPPERQAAAYAQALQIAARNQLDVSDLPREWGPEVAQKLSMKLTESMALEDVMKMGAPLSPAGKVAADVKAGHLTPEQADRHGGGKFYAVPTGSGTMLIDKTTGRAAMLGVGDDGSPVRIGQWFVPEKDQHGQPLPLQAGGGTATPPQGAAQGQPAAPQQPRTPQPLMPPSIAADAQGRTAAAKAQGAAEGKRAGTAPQRLIAARSALNELETQHGVVGEDIDRALGMAGAWTTGIGSTLSGVPGTEAHDLANLLNTIKSNIGFDKLQAMREASPNGGALGQVSDRENTLLQSVLGALEQSQSAAQFRANLTRLKTILADRKKARREAFQSDFGESFGKPGPNNLPGTAEELDKLSNDEILKRLGLR